jgi:hypothetical protein
VVRLTALFCVFLLVMAFHTERGLVWLHLELQNHFATPQDIAQGKNNVVECGNIYDTLIIVLSFAPWITVLFRIIGTLVFELRDAYSYRSETAGTAPGEARAGLLTISIVAALHVFQEAALDVSSFFLGLACVALSVYTVSEIDQPRTTAANFQWDRFPGTSCHPLALAAP